MAENSTTNYIGNDNDKHTQTTHREFTVHVLNRERSYRHLPFTDSAESVPEIHDEMDLSTFKHHHFKDIVDDSHLMRKLLSVFQSGHKKLGTSKAFLNAAGVVIFFLMASIVALEHVNVRQFPYYARIPIVPPHFTLATLSIMAGRNHAIGEYRSLYLGSILSCIFLFGALILQVYGMVACETKVSEVGIEIVPCPEYDWISIGQLFTLSSLFLVDISSILVTKRTLTKWRHTAKIWEQQKLLQLLQERKDRKHEFSDEDVVRIIKELTCVDDEAANLVLYENGEFEAYSPYFRRLFDKARERRDATNSTGVLSKQKVLPRVSMV
eukprot:Colp12_sorted_trinity150504_noHs@25843